MRRTPASEQYLQAQITLLLHIVYASLLCASIKRSLRLQQALENGPSPKGLASRRPLQD